MTRSLATVEASVVVCTRHDAARLAMALPPLLTAIDECPLAAELVLVDNSVEGVLSEQIRSVTTDDRVVVVRAQAPGLSRARAVGCTHASGAYIAMTDDDVEVPPSWLADLLRPLQAGDAEVAVGQVRLADDPRYPVEPLLRRWLAETDARADHPILVGASFAFARTVLETASWDSALGAGAPETGFGEDVLFEWMARRGGARIVSAVGPPVIHRPDADRLTREAWLDAACKRGRSDAYIAHHWLGTRVRLLKLRALRHRLRLIGYRVRQRPGSDAIPTPAELELVRELAQSVYLARLRSRPGRYV